MLQKIKREVCVIKYRNLPLSEYDKQSDSEIYHYPSTYSLYWIKRTKNSSKDLLAELIKLIEKLSIRQLIFLKETNAPWISKNARTRVSVKKLAHAVGYFKSHKIGKHFNGGIQIATENLNQFLPHFFKLTQCDACFHDFNFMDVDQQFIFTIHYSGEVSVMIIDQRCDEEFLKFTKETDFIDCYREGTQRI